MLIKRFKAKGFTKDISKLNKGVPNVFEAGQFKPFEAETNIGVKVLIKLLEAKAKEIARKISVVTGNKVPQRIRLLLASLSSLG